MLTWGGVAGTSTADLTAFQTLVGFAAERRPAQTGPYRLRRSCLTRA